MNKQVPLSRTSTFLRAFFVAFVLTTIACLCSCVTNKQRLRICQTCPIKIETHEKDSIGEPVVKKTLYDSLLNVRNHQGATLVYTNCDSLVKTLLKAKDSTIIAVKDGVKSTISDKGGKITFKCETDSLKEVVRILKLQVNTPHYKIKETIKEVPARCEKEHIGWWDKLFIVCGKIFLCCVGVTIIWVVIWFKKKV